MVLCDACSLFCQGESLPPSVTVAALWRSLFVWVVLQRGSRWADRHFVSYCSPPRPCRTVPLLFCVSACPRNKVVPSNCSNGVLSSLDSWPWLCVIRVGQCGLEVAPEVSSTPPVTSQYLWLNSHPGKTSTMVPFQTGQHLNLFFFLFHHSPVNRLKLHPHGDDFKCNWESLLSFRLCVQTDSADWETRNYHFWNGVPKYLNLRRMDSCSCVVMRVASFLNLSYDGVVRHFCQKNL